MSAGSEFALRIALCDLVERLKRSEQMCKYLERCRNELAKELIRVKQENQVISRENSMMAASLENTDCVQMTTRTKSSRSPAPAPTPSPASGNENELPVRDEILDKSTDWEEITARLLNQLRKEVEQMATPKGTAIISGSILPEEDQRNKSVGSVFVLPASSSADPNKKTVSVEEESTRMMKVSRGGEDGIVSGSPSNSKFGTEVEEAVEVVPGRKSLTLSANHSQSSGLGRGGGERGEVRLPMDEMYLKLVQDLTSDLNKFAEQVSVQNEKLTRIKSKQLRSYFKRQLKPSEKDFGVRSGENDLYLRRQQQQHSKSGMAELI